jgi:GNAT superfamily N-acetyltransferase
MAEAALRRAVTGDAPAIESLMEASIRAIFPDYYFEPQQIESSVRFIGRLDMHLIEDETYFVHEAHGQVVSCGGWSRRNKLLTGPGEAPDDDRLLDPATEPARVRAMFVRADWRRRGLGSEILEASENAARAEGFTSFALRTTLPGAPLYRSYGFKDVGRFALTMPDGVSVEGISMEREFT